MVSCSSPSSVLCHLPSLLLLLQLLPLGGYTEAFRVYGPTDPIVAMLGKDTTLPCSLYPRINAENMELRWFRSSDLEPVFIYQDRQEQSEELRAQYARRTSLLGEFLSQGQATVRIHKVQASDSGLYTCLFRDGDFSEQADLELQVAGMGSVPQIHIMGSEEDGVRMVCTALGWFPKPQVQWRGPHGEKLLALSEVQAQDSEGLFSVEVTLVVRDSSLGSVTCSILNPVLGQEKTMAMLIPEPFFPRSSPWKPAFLVSMPLLLLLLLGAACYIRREHCTHMQELQEQRSLCQAKDEDRQTKEEALKDRDELQAMLGQRKAAYLAAWRKAQLYSDWRKEQFQAWSVTLDPYSSHWKIVLSSDNKSLTCNPDDVGERCVWGLKGITSGRCYWEVEVRSGERSWWGVGVHDKMKYEYSISPKWGFWVVGQKVKGFCAYASSDTWLSLRQLPHRVGVFLDYNQGDVSFYNMTDGSHIFSFPPTSFSRTLFPFFICFFGDVSMTFCPLEPGPPKPSFLVKDPPLEKPVDHSGEGFLSSSNVDGDGAPPGPEAPLLSCTPETMSP